MLWACFTYNLQHWIRLNKFRATPAVTGGENYKTTNSSRKQQFDRKK